MVLTSHAETTTDNLLTNKDFDSGLENWTVEDSTKIMLDTNCYSETGLCQSVRWSGDLGKTISQTISNLESNYIIKNVYLSFTALGCNNKATGAWCSEGTDYDKVQAVIQLSDGTNQENLYLQQNLDYNDSTQDYSLSTQTLDTWLTNDLTVDFSMTGIDTGNWDGWFGPIVDNINLQLGLEEYVPMVVQPSVVEPTVVEPTVAQPIIEPIIELVIEDPVVAVIEETKMIKGLDLKTEIITDVIIDTPAQIDMASVQLPELPPVDIDIPDVSTELDIEPIAEIKEEVNEPEPETKESSSKEEENSNTEETTTEKNQEKPESKTVAKVNEPVVNTQEPSDNADTLGEVALPLSYLQVIQDTIKITETVSLTQEMIYEQDIGAFTSSATYDSLKRSADRRWLRMVDVRPKHTFGGYGR